MAESGSRSRIKYCVDWNKCALCQADISEKLRCPLDSKQKDADSWCDTICYNIRQLYELECIPVNIKYLASLEENEDLTQLFRENQVKWHKSCRDKFNNQKLERAEKRKTAGSDENVKDTSAKFTENLKYMGKRLKWRRIGLFLSFVVKKVAQSV